MNEPTACKTPGSELIIERCWSPPCRNIAAFKDGMGWWYCFAHRDRGQWGVGKIQNWDEVCAKIRKLEDVEE